MDVRHEEDRKKAAILQRKHYHRKKKEAREARIAANKAAAAKKRAEIDAKKAAKAEAERLKAEALAAKRNKIPERTKHFLQGHKERIAWAMSALNPLCKLQKKSSSGIDEPQRWVWT